LLVAATAWPLWCGAAGGLVPQHTEDLRPSLKRAPGGDAATLVFTAFGRDFRVQLSGNQRLAKVAAGSAVQLYRGAVEGLPGSWARISIGVHDGLPRGLIWDGQELLVVEAAPQAVNYGAAGTVIFRLSDAVLERGVSFMGDEVQTPRDAGDAWHVMMDELRDRTPVMQAAGAVEGVEISILGDSTYQARFSGAAQARDAILTRLNNVDGIFSAQLGVELQVASVNIGDELTAGLPATTDSSALLDALGRLRQATPALAETGLTHLITGRELDGDTSGVAYTLSLCSPRYASSLSSAHNSTTLDSLIIAHEIAHVFGAPHDGVQQCAATPQGQFIMTPTINSSINSFSQCSIDQINAVIDSYSCVVEIAPSAPPPPEPPAPPPGNGGGDGGGGGGGGGGSLDPSWLLGLLALRIARSRRRAGGDQPA
jgi:hypothetical protein